MSRRATAFLLIVLLISSSAHATRYLFYNVYGDATALLTRPNDVIAVPFGWDPATETSRNAAISSLGASVSELPSMLYQNSGRWIELRIGDQSKPWSWAAVNAAISSIFIASMIGDSIIDQMRGVQASQAAPFTAAQNLGVSGTTTSQIESQVASISGASNRVIVEGGINDLIAGTSNSTIVANYTTILSSISSSQQIILIGIVPIDETQLHISRPTDPETNSQISAVNTLLTALCNSRTNCTPALGVMSKNMTGKTIDGIHIPSAAGYQDLLASVMPSL